VTARRLLVVIALSGCSRSPSGEAPLPEPVAEAAPEEALDAGEPPSDAIEAENDTARPEDAAPEDAARRLRLEVGTPAIESGSIADADRQLVLMKPALRTCYELWGRSSDVLTMQVSVTLDAKGKVDASGVKAREPLPRALRDCIQSVVRRTRFQVGDAKPARLSFSLSYAR